MTAEVGEVGLTRAPNDDDPRARSFAEFYADQYAATKRLAHVLTGSAAAAEDIAQGAFESLYPRFAQIDQPHRYLRTITVNLCRRTHRRMSGERDRFTLIGVNDVVLPSETVELLSGVRRLPFRQQAVLVLRYWARLTEAEIAETLDCPTGTVKSLHYRALANLRREFA